MRAGLEFTKNADTGWTVWEETKYYLTAAFTGTILPVTG